MKNNYLISTCIVLTVIASIFSKVVNGQNKLIWKEIPSVTQNINDDIPEGKALFVFDAKEDFLFDSDVANIEQPKKEGSLYKLLVDIEPSAGGITINHEGIYSNNYIPYGKDNSISLPPLNNKEIKFFKLTLTTTVEYYDVTTETEKSGSIYAQALYEKEALIILNVVPKDLNLTISGSEITKIVPAEGMFKVYVKPVGQQILLKSNNYDDNLIEFEDDKLKPKEVRYYHVRPPQSNKGIETLDSNIKNGSYSIESTPVGALIQITGNKSFNEQKLRTPYTIENYKEGKEIITLALDRYETIMDTILISSSDGKKSNYNLIPKFAFIKCNIEPAIPNSIILMDGKELSLIENDIAYECPKGFHTLEIDAPGFYSEVRQVSFAAGKTNEINVRLKPSNGSFPNRLSNTDVFLGGQPASGGYQRASVVGYQRAGNARYQPAPAALNQRAIPVVNYQAPAAGYQRAGSARYQPSPSALNQRATSIVNQQTPVVVNQRAQVSGRQQTPAAVNQRAQVSGYQRTPAAMKQRTTVGGYQQSPASGYQRTPTTGYQRTPTTGYQRTPAASYQQRTPAASYQKTPASSYQKTPAASYKK